MNVLDANPELAGVLNDRWKKRGTVPVAVECRPVPGGEWEGSRTAFIGVPAKNAPSTALPDPFTAEDFIVGMELLGFRFSIGDLDGKEALCTLDPDDLPESWLRHSMRLLALCRGRDRVDGCIAFLRERDRLQ